MKKIVSIALAATLTVWLVGALPTSAATADELQAQIASLLATIQALQAQLNSVSGGTGTATGSTYSFTRDLTLGSTGADVKALQQLLNANGYSVAASGAGSVGNESTYFGNATKAALAKWQAAKGITPAVGYFGSRTRAALAGTTGTTGGTVVMPGTSYLSVMADGPAVGTIPDGSIYNSLLRLKFSAGNTAQTITGVTVSRGGYIANTLITGVSVWDEMGNRYGNIITALTSDGRATVSFPNTPFVVPAGQTKTLIVTANISADAGSGTVSFSVNSASDISVAAGSAALTGTFPLSGNVMTVVDGSNSLGNVYVDDQSVAGGAWTSVTTDSGNVEIGDVQREIFKLRLVQNNSKEAVRLEKITLFVEGTLREASDVKNWKLYSPQGDVLATADHPSDRYITFTLATPYVVDKGLTKDFSVKADILDGSGYYFRVYVQNDYDVVVRGVTTGAAVLALDSSGGSLTGSDTQNANGAFKMKAGALTVSKAPTSPSGNIAPASQSVVLAKFDLRSTGEQLEVRKMGVQIDLPAASAGSALTGTLLVRDATTGENFLSISADTSNLQIVGTPDAASLLTYQRDLSSYISIASGQTRTIEVVGTVSATATSSANYTVYIGQLYTKRISTNDYTNLGASAYQGNNLTVSSVSLSVTKSAAFANSNRAAGATNVKIAEFVLQPASADDVRVNSISLSIASSSFLQNVKLMMDGTQLGSTIGSPSATGNSFTVNTTLTKSSTKTLQVYADIRSDATADTGDGLGTTVVSITDSTVSGYGVLSGVSLSTTPNGDLAGQTITVKTGTLTVSRDGAAPTSQIVLAGQQGVELNRIKLESANEDLTLRKITLQMTTASSVLWTAATNIAANISKIYLYDGATLLNAGGTSLASGNAIIDGLSLVISQDTPKALIVKADITPSGTLTSYSVGGIQVKSTSTSDMEVYSSAGLMSSGITLGTAATSNSNNFLFTDSAPTITGNNVTSNGSYGSAVEVARFTVNNPGTRTITLATTTILVTLSNASNTGSLVMDGIYEANSDTLIDADTTSLAGDATLTSTSTSVGFSMGSYNEIAAGQSRTYVVKANTNSVRTGRTAQDTSVFVNLRINGAKGYSSTDITGTEKYWGAGTINYSYTPSSGVAKTGLLASDSGVVYGPTLSF